MSQRLRKTLENLVYVISWLVLVVLATLTGFQIHTTLITLALAAVNNPSLRPSGWTTQTIYGLSRFLWLALGIVWLVWVMFTQEYLSEGKQLQILRQRIMRLLIMLGITYAVSYLVLLFF